MNTMPKAKFIAIYQDLKHAIYQGVYPYQSILPSENDLASAYECSRNTIRRALGILVEKGWVLPMHGKGVRVIYRKIEAAEFTIGGIETFKETSKRNHLQTKTHTIFFKIIQADAALSQRSGFPVGTKLYALQRLRYINGEALILDYNYFRCDLVPNLTIEIANNSIYEYIEKNLGIHITISNRRITVEPISEKEAKYMDVGDYNCVAVMTSITFDNNGQQIEYTRSCHNPGHFCFYDTAAR